MGAMWACLARADEARRRERVSAKSLLARRLVLFAALLVLAVGCGAEPELEVTSFALEVPGAPARTVGLPTHLDLPAAPLTFALRASVELPDALRNRDLTLSIPYWRALVGLRAGGETVDALDGAVADTYRGSGPHRFRIPASAARGDRLDLELTVRHSWSQSGWLDTVPTLGIEPQGALGYRAVRLVNGWGAAINVGFLWGIGFMYVIVYAFDRRRRAYLYLAIQALGGSYYAVFDTGAAQALGGTFDINLMGIAIVVSATASVYFTHEHFGLGRPSRAFLVVGGAVIGAELVLHDPFTTPVYLGPAIVVTVVSLCIYQMVRLGRLALRPPRRRNAGTLLFAWATFSLGGADFLEWTGAGTRSGGVHGALVTTLVFAIMHAIVLSREHVSAFRDIARLGAERAEKIALLEVQQQALEEQKEALERRRGEIETLNEELRRQVAERSRQLSEALARISIGYPRAIIDVGDLIDERYRVMRVLGGGAMGEVFAVERVTDGRPLALKIVKGAQASNFARLAREAQIAAELHHPNLVSIFDVGVSASGVLYLVMELVDGPSLLEARERYGDVHWGCEVLSQVARGLAAIHARGVVHRDLKPANILLSNGTAHTTVKIADFGIASLPTFGASASLDPAFEATVAGTDEAALGVWRTSPPSPSLTKTGALVGTPLYMAPELARAGSRPESMSDVYSFGVVAFEVLTGRLPFEAVPITAALSGRAPELFTLTAVHAGIAAPIAAMVDACLALDPAERPTAAAVARVLARTPATALDG